MALLAYLLQLDGVLVQHVEVLLGLVLLQEHQYLVLLHLQRELATLLNPEQFLLLLHLGRVQQVLGIDRHLLQQALGVHPIKAEGGLVISQQS